MKGTRLVLRENARRGGGLPVAAPFERRCALLEQAVEPTSDVRSDGRMHERETPAARHCARGHSDATSSATLRVIERGLASEGARNVGRL